jgi:hypothetical protein
MAQCVDSRTFVPRVCREGAYGDRARGRLLACRDVQAHGGYPASSREDEGVGRSPGGKRLVTRIVEDTRGQLTVTWLPTPIPAE